MTDRHISSLYESSLDTISARVLEMGGLVEVQVSRSVQALADLKGELASEVLEIEARVNQMELSIDQDLSSIIARHQPTARDLRLLIAVSKAVANLERVGDEAARIARTISPHIKIGLSLFACINHFAPLLLFPSAPLPCCFTPPPPACSPKALPTYP